MVRITRNCFIVAAKSDICEELMWNNDPFPKKKYKKGTILTVRPFGSLDHHNGTFSVDFTGPDKVWYTTYRLRDDCFEFV